MNTHLQIRILYLFSISKNWTIERIKVDPDTQFCESCQEKLPLAYLQPSKLQCLHNEIKKLLQVAVSKKIGATQSNVRRMKQNIALVKRKLASDRFVIKMMLKQKFITFFPS